MEYSKQADIILSKIRREMDGMVSDEMKRRGIIYGENYGVSTPVLGRIAKDFSPDTGFADYLLQRDVREFKLLAVYIADPSDITMETLTRWEEGLTTGELIDNASMFLFPQSPVAVGIMKKWFGSGNRLFIRGALYLLGRLVNNKTISNKETFSALPFVKKAVNEENVNFIYNAAIYCLLKTAASSECGRIEIERIIRRWKLSVNPGITSLAEELELFLPPLG